MRPPTFVTYVVPPPYSIPLHNDVYISAPLNIPLAIQLGPNVSSDKHKTLECVVKLSGTANLDCDTRMARWRCSMRYLNLQIDSISKLSENV